MRVIGFRATPKEVHFAVVNCTETLEVSSLGKIAIPVALSFPEQLNYLRTTIKDLISEFQIQRAGIRITESNAQNISITRVSFEAVIQELISNSTVEKYFAGQISNITAKLGVDRKDFLKIMDNSIEHYKDLKLSEYKDNNKEAILVAIASINL